MLEEFPHDFVRQRGYQFHSRAISRPICQMNSQRGIQIQTQLCTYDKIILKSYIPLIDHKYFVKTQLCNNNEAVVISIFLFTNMIICRNRYRLKMEYQVFLCIFQKNSAMATLGLREMGNFLWEGREKSLPRWLSQFSFVKLRQPTGQTFYPTFPKEFYHFLQT